MDLGANVRMLTLGSLAVSSLLLMGGGTPLSAQTAKKPHVCPSIRSR